MHDILTVTKKQAQKKVHICRNMSQTDTPSAGNNVVLPEDAMKIICADLDKITRRVSKLTVVL